MENQYRPGFARVETLDELQIEAEEKSDAEGRRIVKQGGQVGEGEYAVVAQEVDVENRVFGTRFQDQEVNQAGRSCGRPFQAGPFSGA